MVNDAYPGLLYTSLRSALAVSKGSQLLADITEFDILDILSASDYLNHSLRLKYNSAVVRRRRWLRGQYNMDLTRYLYFL